MTTIDKPSQATTGIGSLPHHNIDAALAFSFQMGIPFLPQIPIRNPWEYMIAQALEGMPGLLAESDGSVSLDVDVWAGRTRVFNEKLLGAFNMASKQEAFEAFEPSAATSSSWQPFLWELEERKVKLAKIQLAGPLTSQWAIRFKDGTSVEKHPDIGTQIYRTVLARALGMCRRLTSSGIQPLIYLDEPGLYAFSATNPRHVLALQELRLLVQTLKKEGVWVGLHCCSNTDWESVLKLDLDYLSLDMGLSLSQLLAHREAYASFLAKGGRLSIGVVPTSKENLGHAFHPKELHAYFFDTLMTQLEGQSHLIKKTVQEALFTPACGLALLGVSEAEAVLECLKDFTKLCENS